MKTHTIDLVQGLGSARVISGRPKGEARRAKEKLDTYDVIPDMGYRLVVPEKVFSVSSSFLLGLFGDSIRTLGEARFRERLTVDGRLPKGVLDYAIRQALRESSAIPEA